MRCDKGRGRGYTPGGPVFRDFRDPHVLFSTAEGEVAATRRISTILVVITTKVSRVLALDFKKSKLALATFGRDKGRLFFKNATRVAFCVIKDAQKVSCL